MKEPFCVNKPWGSFLQFSKDEKTTVKLLEITEGEEFSLQAHKNREEFWYVIEGSPVVEIGEMVKEAGEGETFNVPKNTRHRVRAPHSRAVILEVSRGVFDEEDITRFEDKYGRS